MPDTNQQPNEGNNATDANMSSDPRGGGPQPEAGADGSNTVFIILLILIVLVIGFLLFSSDSAESPTAPTATNTPATTTEQPDEMEATNTDATTSDDMATSSENDMSDEGMDASATGSIEVNSQ